MQQPARMAGIAFGDDAAQQLCNDLRRVQVQQPDGSTTMQPGDYVEPMQLQVVCRQLWDDLPTGQDNITADDIARVGNVDTALARYYAEQVATAAQQTATSERAIREWVDTRLITEQGIRGQVLKGVEQSDTLPNAAIEHLINAHLLRAEKRRGMVWFELAHDRLIDPVRTDNAAWREANLSLLQRQAALWEQERRAEGWLLQDRALREVEQWATTHPHDLTQLEHEFLAAARTKQRGRQRFRNMAYVALVFSIIATVMLFVALIALNRATTAEQDASREASRAQTAEAHADENAAKFQIQQQTAVAE